MFRWRVKCRSCRRCHGTQNLVAIIINPDDPMVVALDPNDPLGVVMNPKDPADVITIAKNLLTVAMDPNGV